ncbi:MAG: hypothetical protein JNL08_08275 [Planctomycetes bacterium]|nr:hypothetical protein [Planctomycetota bacterium]
MLVKGVVFATLLATTPFAVLGVQEPKPAPDARPAQELQDARQQLERDARALAAARAELDAARAELQTVRRQLDEALDALDGTFRQQRDRDCSPSRSRALMSHYQWLEGHGHADRAAATLAQVVDQLGDDPRRLNSAAWSLMTDDETAGKYDKLALAIADRLEQLGDDLEPRLLDTVALARFLNGQVDRAVALQRRAIEQGARGEEFRRRLRTYEAAQTALARAATTPVAQPAVLVAQNDE